MELLFVVVVAAVLIAGLIGWARSRSNDLVIPANVEVPVDSGEPLLLAEVAPAETIDIAKVALTTTAGTTSPLATAAPTVIKPKRSRKKAEATTEEKPKRTRKSGGSRTKSTTNQNV